MKPDLCKWWNESRIATEEGYWQSDRFFVRYANYVKELAATDPNIKTVVEVGCGMGHVGNELKGTGLLYYGTDGSELMIQKAKAMYPDLKFGVVDIRDIAEDPLYDVVCCYAVMKHFHANEFMFMLHKVLSLATYGIIQLQVRVNGAPSAEDDFFGPEVAHTWMAESAILEAYNRAGHDILNPYQEQWRDTTAYIADSREAVIFSKRRK